MMPEENAKFELLPTEKAHVSFSELRDWQDCSYRHKLKYVKKIVKDDLSPILDFGTAVHAACERFLTTKTMDPEVAVIFLKESWKKNEDHPAFPIAELDSYIEQAKKILAEVPAFMEANFPGWECIDAEHALYEPVESHPHAFKGFIDCIIKVKTTKGKKTTENIWLLDWKTASWGWQSKKKSDPNVTQQLTFYKNFWTKKVGVDPKNVKCGFIILKRTAKDGGRCELVKVSVGDVTTGRSLKVLRSMLTTVKKGIAIKNRSSCTYCPYLNTEHCLLQKNALVTPVSQILRCHEIS